MVGTLINVVLILVGCSLGLILRKGVSDRFRDAIMQGLALCVILIGASGALGINGTEHHSIDTLCVIICMAAGGLIGCAINIEDKLDRLGKFAQKKMAGSGNADNSFSKAFVTSSLVYCVGAMAIVGAISSGIRGDHSTLIAKGIIDGITAIIFTSMMGPGVFLSAAAVFIYQGLIALMAGWLAPFLTDTIIDQMSAVGGLLVIGVGLNMLRDKHIAVGNLLPAIFLPILYMPLVSLF